MSGRSDAEAWNLSSMFRRQNFVTVMVWNNRVYVFAGDYETDRPWWQIRKTVMISSDDSVNNFLACFFSE